MAEEKPKLQSWREIQITSDMPLKVLVNFMNVLNQRLSTIEDYVQVPFQNKMISLTELYALQAEAERKAAEEQAKKDEEQVKEKKEE